MARGVGERVIVLDLDLDQGRTGGGESMLRGEDGRVRRVPGPVSRPVPAGLESRGRVGIGRGRSIERDRVIDLRVGRGEGESRDGSATRPKSGPPGRKNSTGEFADTSFCPRLPPPQTSSIILARE